jgi:hypothetical protein
MLISLFPFGLLAMYVRYREQRTALLAESDSQGRENNLELLKQQHNKVFFYGFALMVLATTLLVWILFVLMPSRQ